MAEGIKGDNSRITRTVPIVSVKELKEGFLFGVKLTDDNGKELKDEVIQQFINNAIAFLETTLDICIAERMFAGPSFSQEGDKLNGNCEEKDYRRTAYQNWGFTQLNNFPVVDVLELRAVYPGNHAVVTFPPSWYKVQKGTGRLNLMPVIGTLSQMGVQRGSMFPTLFQFNNTAPLIWQVDYIAGFEDGMVPADINEAISVRAAIDVLNLMGDLVIGAGIAAESISIDGLTRTINTTASAENHAYSAKVDEYKLKLWGSAGQREQGLIYKLKDWYKGKTIQIL